MLLGMLLGSELKDRGVGVVRVDLPGIDDADVDVGNAVETIIPL